MPDGGPLVSVLVYLVTCSAVLGLVVWLRGRDRAGERLREFAAPGAAPGGASPVGELAYSALPRMGKPLLPTDERQRNRLERRLRQAGLYHRHALPLFLGVKMALMAVPALAALVVGLTAALPTPRVVLLGLSACSLGMIAPGLWLDRATRRRQAALRRGLPDALDMMVLCLEGGLSLRGAVQRVTAELQTAHPLLARELTIVQREIMLGSTAGEGLRRLADRCDLEEMASLASVLLQAEKLGASMAKAMRIHADTLRVQRQQRAEELAQKAAVKILFPTLLCIFPAVFIVILGPAAFQLLEILGRMK